jgi:hypothetical protein
MLNDARPWESHNVTFLQAPAHGFANKGVSLAAFPPPKRYDIEDGRGRLPRILVWTDHPSLHWCLLHAWFYTELAGLDKYSRRSDRISKEAGGLAEALRSGKEQREKYVTYKPLFEQLGTDALP